MPWLGDAIPVEPLHLVVSFGDLIIAVAVADSPPTPPGPGGGLLLAPVAVPAPSRRTARPVHDWGTAPPAVPVSGSHHSAKPEVRAPATVGRARVLTPARHSR